MSSSQRTDKNINILLEIEDILKKYEVDYRIMYNPEEREFDIAVKNLNVALIPMEKM